MLGAGEQNPPGDAVLRDNTLEVEGGIAPWNSLIAGECFSVRSMRGNEYDTTFLAAGPDSVGIYVRLSTGELGRLGRLDPDRIDWTTLRKGPKGASVVKGDEVIIFSRDGTEHRGKVAEPIT